jgi:tRNA uridine 5-carboxymethylaminomethyl modification enzyme
MGDPPSYGSTESSREIGLKTGCMKTGIPPLLDGRTIHYSRLEGQAGNEIPGRFSYLLTSPPRPAALLDRLYQILACGFGDSPLFTGRT